MGSLVFQATLGGQVNLNGPNTASTFDIAVPATTGTMVTTGDTGTVTNTMLAGSIANAKLTNSSVTVGSTSIALGATSTTLDGVNIGATTAGTGAFTTLSASSTVSGAGFSAYLASPPAIGGTAAAAGSFTTLAASSTVSGTGFSAYLASPPAIGGTTAASGRFSSLTNTGLTSGRVVYSTTSGLETDSANLLFDGTTLTVASRGIAKAGMPAGSVLQVVQGTFSTQTSMTGTTPVATGLTATITPTSNTSKILITVYIPAYNATAAANASYSIYKNASSIVQLAYYQTSATTGSNPLVTPYSATYYDSPATTSATTYAIYAQTATSSTHTWAFGNLQCNITLMEIAV
jgi:hypothetical protein